MSRLKKSMDKNTASGNGCFVNAGMVAGVSILTDHKSNLKLHGTLDAGQAMKVAVGLSFTILRTNRKPHSSTQAANELAVIASTNWDEGLRTASSRKTA
jgi:hypothetical protein